MGFPETTKIDITINPDGELKIKPSKLDGCHVCGGKLTTIRGRHPKDPDREVCPTCLQEKMEDIHERTGPDYGKAVTDAEAQSQEVK